MERRTEQMHERGVTATVLVCTNERTEHAACAAVDGVDVADAVRHGFASATATGLRSPS